MIFDEVPYVLEHPHREAMVAPGRRGQHIRARYAFIRNPKHELPSGGDHRDLCWALYDIVDNHEGHERVMAYRVRYQAASEIVAALNAVEEARRLEHKILP